jgi:hypothetical protein
MRGLMSSECPYFPENLDVGFNGSISFIFGATEHAKCIFNLRATIEVRVAHSQHCTLSAAAKEWTDLFLSITESTSYGGDDTNYTKQQSI